MATAEAISYAGATPVFVDIDPVTYTIDASKIEQVITPRTKAIIPVHLFGQCADMDPILALAKKHKLYVIEDGAQSQGATYKGRPSGSIGHAGATSFYPGKNLGAWGEAGAITTNDATLAERMKMFREHGQKRKYYHDVIGWNGRMDGIQAAVLRVKLKYLAEANEDRRRAAARYRELLNGTPGVTLPVEAPYAKHVYHVYAVRVQNRDQLLTDLTRQGIGCGIHYPVPVHLQQAYVHLGHKAGDFPVSEACGNEFLSLPMFPELTDEQIHAVVEAFTGLLAATSR
jgi:dTDP-4-amino-4,6-dideoxygalactose transaminase